MMNVKDLDKFSEEVRKFYSVYGLELEDYYKTLKKQFKNVVTYHCEHKNGNKVTVKDDWDVDVQIVKDGSTKIDMEKKHGWIKFVMYVNYENIMTLHENSNLDVFESFQKIVSHEIMHFLMGHLDKDFNERMHSWALGVTTINHDVQSWNSKLDTYDKIFQMDKNLFCENNNTDVDPCMASIAFDFVVNERIGMDYPGIRANQFGLPEGLGEWHYYSIIYHLLNSYPKGEIKNKWFTSQGINTVLSDHYILYREDLRQLYEMMEQQRKGEKSDQLLMSGDLVEAIDGLIDGDIPSIKYDDVIRYDKGNKQRFEKLQGMLPAMAEKMKIARTGIWKCFNDLLNDMIRKHQKMKLSFVDKRDDWCKFNNRKDYDLIYPGKTQTKGAVERKLEQCSVLFVDISASMIDVIEPLFTFCYFALSKVNMEVVFYDTQIQAIFNNENSFNLEPFVCGGTNAANAVHQYESEFKRPTHVVLLTDAQDSTINSLKHEYGDKLDVWQIVYNSIFKIM